MGEVINNDATDGNESRSLEDLIEGSRIEPPQPVVVKTVVVPPVVVKPPVVVPPPVVKPVVVPLRPPFVLPGSFTNISVPKGKPTAKLADLDEALKQK